MTRQRGRPEDPQAGQALAGDDRQLISPSTTPSTASLTLCVCRAQLQPLFHEVQQAIPLLAKIEVAAGQQLEVQPCGSVPAPGGQL